MRKHIQKVTASFAALLVITLPAAVATGLSMSTGPALQFPGPAPGSAKAQIVGDNATLENSVIAVTWRMGETPLKSWAATDKLSGETIKGNEAFTIILEDERTLKASDLKITGKPHIEELSPKPGSLRLSDRFAGQCLSLSFTDKQEDLNIHWQAVLRDGSNYIRQIVTIKAVGKEIAIKQIILTDFVCRDAKVVGSVAGSPIVAAQMFFACEHPNAKSTVEDILSAIPTKADNALSVIPTKANEALPVISTGVSKANVAEKSGSVSRCALTHNITLRPNQTQTQSSVIGIAPKGQLRRAFACYIEYERPRPFKPFLHYNSWYDIAWADRKMNEQQCLNVIENFGKNLTQAHGVNLDSFVFDDGWDDNETLWGFHKGFPNGFTPLVQPAKKYNSAIGVWLSPWGGYGQAKAERMKYGLTQGFETNRNGFSLAGPKYYARFRDVCADMIKRYDVNYFKFDGVGIGNDRSGADDEFLPDIEGLLKLCTELRQIRPDVYLSITTGTWPSPYWLFYGDSIWRNGQDCGFHGAGAMRQQWITYRDMITFRMIVHRAPLYPLNSLMVQGICYAQLGTATRMANDLGDIVDEINMLFGSGTQLQELYVTPQMMTPPMWAALARAASWSRENTDTLVDVHWIGGDPGNAEVYGYASWSPHKAILVLRNPSEKKTSFSVDVQQVFELPPSAPQRYELKNPLKQDNAQSLTLMLQAGQPHNFDLAPFEALILEALPIE